MATSYRIQTNEVDRSGTVSPDIGSTGAMVVTSERGPTTPMYFSTGQYRRMLDIFGEPSVDYPNMWEAVQFNQVAPMWLASAYDAAADKIGGVIFHDGGVEGISSDGGLGEAGLSAGITVGEEANHTFADSDQYFLLLYKWPVVNTFLRVSAERNSTTELFEITLQIKRGQTWETYGEYAVSLDPDKAGDYGRSAYIEDVFQDHDLIQVVVNSSATYTAFSAATNVEFNGNTRTTSGGTYEAALLAVWDEFQAARKYPTDIFMDVTELGVESKFATLRDSYQMYSSYILPIPAGEDVATAITTKSGYPSNRGLAAYWNHGLVSFNNKRFWTSLIGRVGAKYAAMVNVFNGLAPAWVDENGHGGQIGGGIIEMEYDPTQDELKQLDDAGINAIVADPAYGVMVVGQKTAVSPGIVSDDSFIGHSRLFDYIISNIVNQVLVFQLSKLNDPIHRQLARNKGNTILTPIREAGLLNNYKIKCDLGNNNDIARAQRKFVYSVAVQVTPFGEFIEFNFIKTGQTITVDEVLS